MGIEICVEVDAEVVAFVFVRTVFQEAVLGKVSAGDHIVGILVSSADAQAMVGLESMLLCALGYPVGAFKEIPATIGVVRTVVEVGVAHPGALLWIPLGVGTGLDTRFIDHLLLYPCGHAFGHQAGVVHADIAVVADRHLAFLTLLSGHEHHTGGSARTIYGTGGGILEH